MTLKIPTDYKYGFESNISSEKPDKGLSEDTVRYISKKNNEPEWLLDIRLKAYKHWLTLTEPTWANVSYPKIDFQDLYYHSSPKSKDIENDPEMIETFKKLGVPLHEYEKSNVVIDTVFDSISIRMTLRNQLEKHGILFTSISNASRDHPDIIKRYLGSVVPYTDNFYACLNTAVFSDGSFVYIPKGVKCPVELSTYFRINDKNTGQFERTLIIAEDDSYVSYLEGCTAPIRDENQLHVAVVEVVALDNAEVKYSTVQNWWSGDKDGKGGIYNFVTKRGNCKGKNSIISWTQLEVGSAITWKYPSCILSGDGSKGEFYSVAITKNHQQADTGTKMIHLGSNTSSKIISKAISMDYSKNSYRGLVKVSDKASNVRNFTRCDSLLIGKNCSANTFPNIESKNADCILEHEATTSKISEEQLMYLQSRGISEEEAISLAVNGFCKEILQRLPMEFMVEAQKLISIVLEGSVG